MAQAAILEYDAKKIIHDNWQTYFGDEFELICQSILVEISDSSTINMTEEKWLREANLVAKPDMLFGSRGKNDLVFFKKKKAGDVQLADALDWVKKKSTGTTTLLDGSKGNLSRFVIEPFLPHKEEEEFFISATTEKENDILYISSQGGVDIMEDWESKVTKIEIPLLIEEEKISSLIQKQIPADFDNRKTFAKLAFNFYRLFKGLHFTDLEWNPFVLRGKQIFLLDTVAKLDDTAGYLMNEQWGNIEFHSSFGHQELTEEEKEIHKMNDESGASLKLTLLNPKGLVWTLVAGGGASVIFADTVADTWGVKELANYGEYSGNPSKQETFYYAKTVIDFMTREKDPQGRPKILLIGGAIANFTDVAKTFDGIILAFEDMAKKMIDVGVKIYVRRGGPNYEIGLKNIRTAAKKLKLPIEVYGPETHLTEIVKLSLDDSNTVLKDSNAA